MATYLPVNMHVHVFLCASHQQTGTNATFLVADVACGFTMCIFWWQMGVKTALHQYLMQQAYS